MLSPLPSQVRAARRRSRWLSIRLKQRWRRKVMWLPEATLPLRLRTSFRCPPPPPHPKTRRLSQMLPARPASALPPVSLGVPPASAPPNPPSAQELRRRAPPHRPSASDPRAALLSVGAAALSEAPSQQAPLPPRWLPSQGPRRRGAPPPPPSPSGPTPPPAASSRPSPSSSEGPLLRPLRPSRSGAAATGALTRLGRARPSRSALRPPLQRSRGLGAFWPPQPPLLHRWRRQRVKASPTPARHCRAQKKAARGFFPLRRPPPRPSSLSRRPCRRRRAPLARASLAAVAPPAVPSRRPRNCRPGLRAATAPPRPAALQSLPRKGGPRRHRSPPFSATAPLSKRRSAPPLPPLAAAAALARLRGSSRRRGAR